VNFPTRFQKNQGTSIKNIMVDNSRSRFCTVLPLSNVLSDHDAQCLIHNTLITKMKVVTHSHIQNKINHKTYNYTFSELLFNEIWVFYLNDNNSTFIDF
jgi:hypothetical protein